MTDAEVILVHEWRQGRRVGRCIHMMVGTEPSEDDVLIGVFDDPALAKHIVTLHNAAFLDPEFVYGEPEHNDGTLRAEEAGDDA